MENKETGSDPKKESTNEELFSDERTDEKMHRHIADINDVITEQDIRNVKTDFNMDDWHKEENGEPGVANGDSVEQSAADPDTNLVTPWDVIK